MLHLKKKQRRKKKLEPHCISITSIPVRASSCPFGKYKYIFKLLHTPKGECFWQALKFSEIMLLKSILHNTEKHEHGFSDKRCERALLSDHVNLSWRTWTCLMFFKVWSSFILLENISLLSLLSLIEKYVNLACASLPSSFIARSYRNEQSQQLFH